MLNSMVHGGMQECCISLWQAGVAAVQGRALVRNFLATRRFDQARFHIAAVGKAASGMMEGALDVLPGAARCLLITKDGHVSNTLRQAQRICIIESAHPVPDVRSLQAGRALRQFAETVAAGEHLLLLVSGGASALVEDPDIGVTLHDISSFNRSALANGKSIREINAARTAFSRLKGGKLMALASAAHLHVLQISDVEPGDEAFIGSGLGSLALVPDDARLSRESLVLGDNARARAAIEQAVNTLGMEVRHNSETLYGDLMTVAARLARTLTEGPDGVYIWGGEPTVCLPENPGQGGRNQSLALALAIHLCGQSQVRAIVAGTDGTDGPTSAAGGLVPRLALHEVDAAKQALVHADAGPFLAARNCLFSPGPTGTNVMDIVVAVKSNIIRGNVT